MIFKISSEPGSVREKKSGKLHIPREFLKKVCAVDLS